MLPGDELVADYLARAGRAAAAALAPADSVAVVEEVGRRVRARVGAPPRWDLHGTQARLAELGEAENLVDAVARELVPAAFDVPDVEADAAAQAGTEPEPEAEQVPPPQVPPPPLPPTPLPPIPSPENPTLDLGPVPRPVLPAQAEARVSETAGGGSQRGPFRPLFRDEETPRVRPIAPDEPVPREAFSDLNRLGWELVALVVLGFGVFPFGYLGWALGAVLITRSRYWEISDKVRVLFGMPTAALGLAVLWAWLQSTQIQESNNSGTRLSEAGDSLADSFAVMPELCGVLGAIYLAYALVRDHHAG
jgi:hypothetical protein